jgi:hypothetical protein
LCGSARLGWVLHNLDMATWQFDLHLIPRSELQKVFGYVPTKLDRETFNAVNWWQTFHLPSQYREMLSGFAQAGTSWCEEIELWGDMEGDRVEVCRDEGEIDTVYIRINAANLNSDFINGVSDFAQACDCLIFTEDKELIEPVPKLLGKAVLQSNAARFVADPHEFLRNLETNGLEP